MTNEQQEHASLYSEKSSREKTIVGRYSRKWGFHGENIHRLNTPWLNQWIGVELYNFEFHQTVKLMKVFSLEVSHYKDLKIKSLIF
jgi:hypothetical protein